MKSIIATLALVLGTQAHAVVTMPDMIYTTIRCERSVDVQDAGLRVEVRSGGLAGLTQVVITEIYEGGSTVHSQYVREKISPALGAPIVYEGNGVSLSINFTTAPDAKGGHRGVLRAILPNDQVMNEVLSCQGVMHAM